MNLHGSSAPDYRRIHLIFANSSYGKKLKSEIRFGPYKPQSLTNQEWIKILGRDVNNLYHMPFTSRLTIRFLNGCSSPYASWNKKLSDLAIFNQAEKDALVLAATIHDWAESVIGDIPAPLKTLDQEKEELKVLKGLVVELLGSRSKYKQFVPTINSAIDNVIENRNSKLGMAFDAIERMGYYKVGLRAWILRNRYPGELQERLLMLGSGPTAPIKREREKLFYYSGIYPPVHYFMNKPINKRIIEQVLLT